MTVSIEKRKWLYGMVFLCCVILSGLSLYNTFEMKLVSDNIGVLFLPATIAGRDWSGWISLSAYYGWLYYILYTPLFMISQNPYFIYGAVCILNILVRGLIGVLIYHILTMKFDMPQNMWTVAMSIISSTYAIVSSTNFSSELPALLIVWILTLLILKAHTAMNSKKRKCVYSVLIPLLIALSYNIHTRLVILFFAVAIGMLVYYLIYKQWYLYPIIFFGGSGVGFAITYALKTGIVQLLWQADSATEVRNATLALPKYVSNFRGSIQVVLDIVISNFYKLSLETRGIMLLCAVCLIGVIIKEIGNHGKTKKNQSTDIEKKVVVVSVTFGAALVATICTIPLYFGSSITNAYDLGIENARFSAFTYLRYYYLYFGPLFVATMAILKHNLIEQKNLRLRYAVPALVGMALYIFFSVLPHLSTYYVNFYNYNFIENDIYRANFWIGVIILFIEITTWFLLVRYHKEKIILLSLVLILVFNSLHIRSSVFFDLEGASGGDASYTVISMIDQNEELPQNIYYLGTNKTYIQFMFMLNWKTIIYSVPESDVEEAIVITSSLEISGTEQLLMDGYTYYQLDADEYIWIKGEELHDKLLPYIQTYWSQSKSISESKITYEDDMYKVGKLLYANGDERSVTAMISNPLDGEYVISVAMDVLRSVDSAIGYADVYVDGGLEQTIELTEAYFDDGQQLDLSAYTSQSQSLEVQIRLCQGTLVRDLSFYYQTSDTSKRMGMNRESELEQIEDIMERLDCNLPLYVLHEYNYYSVSADLSTLKEVFSVKDIDVLDVTEIDLSKYNKDAYILMENDSDNSMIFELVEHYDILCKTSHYTLLMNRNAENEEAIRQADIFCLSSEGRINVDYFRMTADGYLDNNVMNTLAKNIYLVEIEKNTEETGDSAASLQVMNESTNVLSLTTADDNMSGTFCLTEDASISFNWLQQAVDENQGYTVYIMEDIEEFHSGDVISFSDGKLGFYYTSLHATENWGVWTSDKITEFVFEYDGKEDVDIEIELKSLVAQTVNAYIDGDYVGSYEVGQAPTIITIPVSKEYVMDGEIVLELEGEAVWAAGDIVGNADTREIGLGLYSITFKEEQ